MKVLYLYKINLTGLHNYRLAVDAVFSTVGSAGFFCFRPLFLFSINFLWHLFQFIGLPEKKIPKHRFIEPQNLATRLRLD
ncbi:MAG: hypothetical protein KDD10_10605, partial [Phaeodactylibacter sp.]|nr:hypothetical protein [Phaeodactylibacter sp.]